VKRRSFTPELFAYAVNFDILSPAKKIDVLDEMIGRNVQEEKTVARLAVGYLEEQISGRSRGFSPAFRFLHAREETVS
jgi:hypothetical protein